MSRPALLRRHYRTIVAAIAGLLAVCASLWLGARMDPVDGFFYDLSLAATRQRPGTGGDPVAVIALDRGSLAAEELAPLPRTFLGPVWARLLDGLMASGVRAVGFDIIFAYSANRLPGSNGQYDKPFLTALARARDRVVLARSASAMPAPPFFAAVLDPGADAELIADPDGIARRVSASVATADGQRVPTLAAALLARAKAPPMPAQLLLAPRAPLEAIPTYRVIDVLHCLDRDPAALRRVFAGRIVLIGTNLPEEDRKRTPDRFMRSPQPQPGRAGQCALARLGASDPGSGTTPGIFVHAAAVAEVATGDLVRPLPTAGRAAAAAAAGVAGAWLGFLLQPWMAATGLAALGAIGFAAALILLGFGWWLALAVPFGAAVLAAVLAYLVRFLVEERRRRRVQNAFGHYLAPAIVDQLAESEADLHLGGELRDVTIMFADLSGFTALSGKVGPGELMTVTNAYLGLIVAAVEAHGGYVDKFIGDAVMGLWGAPALYLDHAAAASRAALQAVASVLRAKTIADARGEPGYKLKIGLNSGPAVVGNVGAEKRYNYTAVGETVNIAARLEGVPGDYGCRIVVGPRTAALIEDRFLLCELDWIKVKGKEEAIAVYELLGEKSDAGPAEIAYVAQYRAALEQYRAGDFAGAEEQWRRAAHPFLDRSGPSPPRIMAERCAALRTAPPAEWDGVFVKNTK
ncbi:MAG TPA: adenylate/guanylate cyclase domain-containing protein [Stellaceae bacterium]|nr:adenylate/guanylate cyclase domain-containing protein [Stellaceae bacterium]